MTPAQTLEATRAKLGLNKKQMAARLEISPEWYGMIVSGKRPVTRDVMLRHDDVLRREIEFSSGLADSHQAAVRSGAREPVGYPHPSTRADCQIYFQALIEAAAGSGNPNAFPVIHDRLLKLFPLSEWKGAAAPAPPGSIIITPDDIAKMKDVVAKENARALNKTITAAESRPPK